MASLSLAIVLTWFSILGHLSLALLVFCTVVLLLPQSVISNVALLKKLKNHLLKDGKRLVAFTLRSPVCRLIFFCGRKCCCGFLSSRCRIPCKLKARGNSCSEVILDWVSTASYNPFHEELYVVAWRSKKHADDGCNWKEVEIDVNDHPEEDQSKKWRYFVHGLPEQEHLIFRVAARNVYGRSPWSNEVEEETPARPNKDGGFTGPLGPAGHVCGDGRYYWGQTTSEVTFKVPVPVEWTSKHIRFKATSYRLEILHVHSGTSSELLVGEFPEKVKADEVSWEIDKDELHGRHIVVQMPKSDTYEKWPCLLEGHPNIDVKLVRFFSKELTNGIDIYK